MSSKIKCLNQACSSPDIKKIGKVYLKTERVYTQRYQCKTCKKTFVASKIKPIKKQKEKYAITKQKIQTLFCNGMTIRAITSYLNLNRKTINRKLKLIADDSKAHYSNNTKFHYEEHYRTDKDGKKKITMPIIVFDEMETHEHTSLKPLSIGIAYDFYNDKIIDIRVCRFPPRGRFRDTLKHKPELKKRYEAGGFRYVDMRKQMAEDSFKAIRLYSVSSKLLYKIIITDGKKTYPNIIKNEFGMYAKHQIFLTKGIPDVDDSELDEMLDENGLIKDPEDLRDKNYFAINAKTKMYPFVYISAFAKFNKVCALMRLKLAILHRKSFCVTKKMSNLQEALYVFQDWYNSRIPTNEEIRARERNEQAKEARWEEAKKKKAKGLI